MAMSGNVLTHISLTSFCGTKANSAENAASGQCLNCLFTVYSI